MRRLGFALAAFALGVGATAQLSDAERRGIQDALYVGNLRLDDLKFERKPFSDPWRNRFLTQTLDDPIKTADDLLRMHDRARTANPAELLGIAIREGLGDGAVLAGSLPVIDPASLATLPPGLRTIVAELAAAVSACDEAIRASLSKLNATEQRELIEGLPVLAVEEPKVTFDFVRNPAPPRPRLLDLVSRVDLVTIRAAAERLTLAVEAAVTKLRANKEDITGKIRLRVGSLPVLIAGRGADTHDETDVRLTIDLGGNDRYVGRHGAGVGYASVLIDAGGDDTYEPKDLSLGAGILGVGLARDLGGHDVVRGRSLCLGAGLAGVGVYAKDGGHDNYSSVALAQGFGFFGVGLMLDTNGDDTYRLKLMGQGAGRTAGWGWLVDRAGTDVYRAGGLAMNEPLFTGVSYSFAQGFGMGFREDTGGISGGAGLLTDGGGDDAYWGDTYQQAASYWFSLGSLFDASGNDTYTGHHYCQASAMHMTGAYLFDLGGDDAYSVKVGAAHAIGHDYGVAFFLDRSGGDLYASQDSTPGIGVANGLGIFVDGDGTDRYHGPPGKGNAARGTYSLGVFVDLNGADLYRFGLEDAQASATAGMGVAYDSATVTPAASGNAAPPAPAAPQPGSQTRPSDAELDEIYRKASRWGVGSAQQEVAENVNRLIAIGKPAIEWMVERKLAGADRLQIRTFVAVIKGIGSEAELVVAQKAFSATDTEIRNIIQIATDAQIKDIGSLLGGWMERPALQRQAVRAAGPLKATGAIPQLMRFLLSEDRLLARAAMVSLNEIGDPSTVTTAQAMLFSPDIMLRTAALELLCKFPESATATGEQLLKDIDEFRSRVGVTILGRLGGRENLRAVGSALMDPRPGVRIAALQQLDGRCPDEYRSAFNGLKKDPVAVVRAVAARVK